MAEGVQTRFPRAKFGDRDVPGFNQVQSWVFRLLRRTKLRRHIPNIHRKKKMLDMSTPASRHSGLTAAC